ncbi:hypothetical protein GCM10011575_17110 [Microlunatus endophyticus]|uniref:SAM-dependent methyltransferase, MidA family n=1 Tax=Microlunatus endophyticus TaxID=1716077 RepID=A0A917S6B8_9ACTN|nr:hypothetical protein GCM10011575_17110 [Microlunatus endophyticus]
MLAGRPDISTVVDIGAGDGRLLAEIGIRARQLRLIGLDLRSPEPATLPVTWLRGWWDVEREAWTAADSGRTTPLTDVLPTSDPLAIVAAEWLDELPAVVAGRGRDGAQETWREILVQGDGQELLGGPVAEPDAEWLDRWSPESARAESGRSRDRAWTTLLDCLRPAGGLAIIIDYGHQLDERPARGTLAGYQHGHPVSPRPSSAINLTAHVAVDSVRAAGEAAGARTELLLRQREAVRRLLPDPPTEASDTLARLQLASERRLLADNLGDHWWLVQSVDPKR